MTRDAFAQCQKLIEGDEGAISLAGRNNIRHGEERGSPTPISNFTRNLDNFAKIFAIGVAYTAVLEEATSGNLYMSFMGHPPRYGMDADQVRRLCNIVSTMANPPTLDNKVVLCEELIVSGNVLISKLREQYKNNTRSEIRRYPQRREELEERANSPRAFVEARFHEFMTDENLSAIKQYAIRTLTIVPHEAINNGVHVEMKALAFARNRHPEAQEFNVGLAASRAQDPGACFGCSAEFRALSEVRGIRVTRTADFRDNFPPSRYRASSNVAEDPQVYSRFARIVLTETPMPDGRREELRRWIEALEAAIRRERGESLRAHDREERNRPEYDREHIRDRVVREGERRDNEREARDRDRARDRAIRDQDRELRDRERRDYARHDRGHRDRHDHVREGRERERHERDRHARDRERSRSPAGRAAQRGFQDRLENERREDRRGGGYYRRDR